MPNPLKTQLIASLRQNRMTFFKVIATLALGLTANLLTPWPIKILFDDVLLKNGPSEMNKILIAAILAAVSFGLVVMRGYFNHLRYVDLTRLADRAADDLRVQVVDNVLKSKMISLSQFPADDLRARAIEDIDRIRECLVEAVAVVAGEFVTVIVAFAILFFVDAAFASICVVFMTLLFLLYRYVPRSIEVKNTVTREIESQRTSFAGEALRRIQFIKAWTRGPHEIQRLIELNAKYLKSNDLKTKAEARLIFVAEALTALMTASILGYGGFSVASSRISPGDLILFMQYLGFLYSPVGRASGFFLILQRGRASARRIEDILALPHEKPCHLPDSPPPPSFSSGPSVQFENVSFGYRPDRQFLRRLSFTIEPGSIVGIIGASGTGKSTLLKLLLGFYPSSEGQILIDGRPIQELEIQDLRRQIAFVDQESVMFSGSIRENLLYAAGLGAQERFADVCRRLAIDTFVSELTNGYDTPLFEGGATLSMGQRQRLAMARALLSDRPLILLDEPTSALDPKLEQHLVSQLKGLLKGKTVLLVTHRPKPLEIVHQILDLSGKNRRDS